MSCSTSDDCPASPCVGSLRPTVSDPVNVEILSRPCGTFPLLSPTIKIRGTFTGSSDASWRGTKVVLSLGVITVISQTVKRNWACVNGYKTGTRKSLF